MREAWYVVAEARRVRFKPLAIEVCGRPLVVFRDGLGKAAVLEDRCAHRSVALSRGRLEAGCVVCPYHGWTYDGTGQCVAIPANTPEDSIPTGAKVRTFPVIEQDGYVWVWPGDRQPDTTPFRIPHIAETGWSWARLEATVHNAVDNVIENFIDCPHTGYIHGGLFRTPASHPATHVVQATEDGIVIDIDEEAKSGSLLGRLLLRKGEQVEHQDRFIAPSIVQVAYSFGEKKRVVGYQLCTPVSEEETRVYVHVTWSAGWWGPLIRPFVPFIGRVILGQDLVILNHQGDQLRKFGDHPFCSTSADTANLWIAGFRRRARDGDSKAKPHSKKVTFRL